MSDETTEFTEPDELTQRDIQLLVDAAVDYAQQSLENRGLLIPIAVALSSDPDEDPEEVSLFEPDPEPEGDEQAQEALEGLEEHLRTNRANFRAAALSFFVTADEGEEWDAITILIAHSDGTAVDLQIPHRETETERELGELESYEGTLDIWD
jgi:nucleotide-binding universal stress UspA family protein